MCNTRELPSPQLGFISLMLLTIYVSCTNLIYILLVIQSISVGLVILNIWASVFKLSYNCLFL